MIRGRLLSGALLFITTAVADIPLSQSPSWSSVTSNDYSTGGGFWDIDTNGFIDFCVSNGNDMANNRNAIYFNQGGLLQITAGWRSADQNRFGHLYLGDADNDGLVDMAVAHLGPAGDGPPRVYRNIGGTLSGTPWWKAKDSSVHFDCCFGDVNNDGWLDLVIAAGDAYSSLAQPLRIYLNREGRLDTLASWSSANLVQVDAVRFVDLNNDGKLDLLADGKGRFYVYYQRGDSLERLPSWIDTVGGAIMGLRIAVGDYNGDGWLDAAVVHNGQMGTGNAIRIYRNQQGVLVKPAGTILQRRNRYSSCVAWADANNDGWLDLAAGGWWEPVVVYDNRAGTLDTIPGWSWNHGSGLVCETVLWGDVGNRYLTVTAETLSGDGIRKLFYFRHLPIQDFLRVEIEGVPVPRPHYCFDPLTGYISFRNPPPCGANNIVITYVRSCYPDLAVTNWEPSDHNYVFFNTTQTGSREHSGAVSNSESVLSTSIPSHFRKLLRFTVTVTGDARGWCALYTSSGELVGNTVRVLSPGRNVVTLDAEPLDLIFGIYFVKVFSKRGYTRSYKVLYVK